MVPLKSQIKSVEVQLQILKAKIEKRKVKGEYFSSLYGMLQGIADSSYEEIKGAEYLIKEENVG